MPIQVVDAEAGLVRYTDPATGQEVGGVAPTGHPAPLRALVDVDLAAHPLLWAGGGDHHTMVSLTYADLLRLTGGDEAAVA